MSQKLAGSTHDKLQQQMGPIHEEIGRVAVEMEKLRGERAILHAMAVDALGKAGISKDAVSQLAAACW
ncbi:hypothetical protein NKJ23_13765 [Mesorhizobium sp. M0184]|uniref:hypothetical protein n=1 Tax=Mesorhizobium sp. M0184 TaxID=2956906 RepID=UPI003334C5CD